MCFLEEQIKIFRSFVQFSKLLACNFSTETELHINKEPHFSIYLQQFISKFRTNEAYKFIIRTRPTRNSSSKRYLNFNSLSSLKQHAISGKGESAVVKRNISVHTSLSVSFKNRSLNLHSQVKLLSTKQNSQPEKHCSS